jgi:hypothetical protein
MTLQYYVSDETEKSVFAVIYSMLNMLMKLVMQKSLLWWNPLIRQMCVYSKNISSLIGLVELYYEPGFLPLQ